MNNIIQVLYSMFYFVLAGIILALGILSFREEVPAYARDPPVFLPLRKMAVFLYRKVYKFREKRRRIGKDLPIPGEEGVRTDLSILYPSMKARREEVLYRIRRTEKIILLLTAGILLAGALHFASLRSGILREDGSIERAPAGGEDKRISVLAKPAADPSGAETGSAAVQLPAESGSAADPSGAGTGSAAVRLPAESRPAADPSGAGTGSAAAPNAAESGPAADQENGGGKEKKKDYGTYTITVHARQLTQKEAEKRAQEILRQFPECLLGENPDTEEIRYPLRMPEPALTEPFLTDWESSRYAVLDTDGSIFNSEYTEEQAEQVDLTLFLTYADYRFEKKMSFTIRAPVRNEQDRIREEIQNALKTAEKESSAENTFVLPGGADGIALSWEEQIEDISPGILLLGLLVCVSAWYITDHRLHEKTIERSRQLAIDYPQLISRIVLYLGAGMSVRNVFYKCAAEYRVKNSGAESRRSGKKTNIRYLGEEILLVCNELDSGIPEAEAYMHFGRRCRSRQYTKLCSLLVQNLRRGNDTLLEVLQEEAQSAFEERKNLARELGEEAGTKLLLPMMIMLGITMLIIIVPAYFGFAM